ncbi:MULTISPECIES: RNase adapter RapZ [Trueperella]|uniref:GlmZ(SRNA)-inactivating NTPase n=1 Tax=Trueperella bernardiae TaxID=59561 RepID=A0A0W1KM06_9ACTO|nr:MULTISPECIES: RNase adapter RapZ [Trueperella]KTF05026.1 glmZ(sRNA)-inactivating NTPase [Trueperella bernardiae]MCM3906630.1 RNase adapter RapZ [Trueperella bernardiae]MDV6237963.1 RNase adapter RapZ [Trueperella bernardiae]OCW60910.1 glmZ(sRNA)-inactivating NTPase [Trueperella bernardiae]OFS68550.1 RNase adaptor protein RapZ [Trueperella sp. HMSC08H06]
MTISHDDINDTGKIPRLVPELDREVSLPAADIPEILIITGMSGAGRSRAAATLEDIGWYVVDNLPPRLLSALAGLISPVDGQAVRRLAAVVDVRSREYFRELVEVLDQLQERRQDYRIMFLDASDEVLVRRYESVRRPHPLQGDGRLLDGIRLEREVLAQLRTRADMLIDTSSLTVHDLARKIRQNMQEAGEDDPHLTIMSFGFKYGLPMDADHVADVRFLPNPYWVSELRHLTGKDEPVSNFVLSIDGAEEFIGGYANLIDPILEGYKHELKPYVTIAIGCTGGKHRSVAMTERLAELMRARGHSVRVFHRDLGRE